MDSNHKHAIHWARQTAASHRYKLKRQPACQPSTSLAFTSSDRTLREKGLLFFSFSQSLFIHLCFKDVFLFTSNSTQMRHLVESRVWVLAWYSNKKKAAYNNSHMKCHNSPSCMRHWLLTHSDTWALFSAENIFEFMDWQQNLLSCLMTVFIVNGFFVTEEGAGTLWLRDVVHSSCSHSHFIHSGQTTPMTTSLWPEAPHEAPHVLFITIKSAVISGRHRGTTRLNHHLALRHSHLAISVYQADRGVKPSVRDGSFAHANNKPAPSLITAADPQQRGQERQLFEADCIFHYSSTFFFLPPPPLWLIITHEKDQYSIIWPSAKLRQNQSALKKVWQTLFSLSLSDDPTQIGKGITLITVQDINDNAPVFAIDYETLLCENAIPGQVRPRNISAVGLASLPFFLSPYLLEVWLTKTARWLSKPLKPFLFCSSKQVHCVHALSTSQLEVTPGRQHH